MNDQPAHAARRRGAVAGLFLAVAVVTLWGLVAQQALAYKTYMHGGITTCATCHLDGHTRWKPVNEVCNTCHPGYALPSSSTACWTCHTPGQDMSAARSDSSCTAACHLVDGTISTHAAHADRSTVCSTCHPLTVSPTDAAWSPHHTRPLPPAPTITGFLPLSAIVGDRVMLTGSGFVGVQAVSFNGIPATLFELVSGTELTAVVPSGATSGPIVVTTLGGSATSATSLTVIMTVPARVTLRVGDPSIALGRTVRFTGALTPASLGGTKVHLTVTSRADGEWKNVGTASVKAASAGTYAWAYRPSQRGRYRVRAGIAATGVHTAARSHAVALTVR